MRSVLHQDTTGRTVESVQIFIWISLFVTLLQLVVFYCSISGDRVPLNRENETAITLFTACATTRTAICIK